MRALVLRLLLYPTSGFRTQAVESEIKVYEADFTDWMSILSLKLTVEISLNPAAVSAIT